MNKHLQDADTQEKQVTPCKRSTIENVFLVVATVYMIISGIGIASNLGLL